MSIGSNLTRIAKGCGEKIIASQMNNIYQVQEI
jgi:hypothetical protein